MAESPAAAAATQAERTGKPVAVPSFTTQTSEVLAQPDGEFELISNVLPVRVRVNGAWRAISTSLRRNQDGSWSAPLTSAPVTFSGGGSGPMVTITDPATRLSASVWWPYRLPAPAVSGSAALYRSVLPGVDLRLQATATGYQEVLVVHDTAALTDPRLQKITFTLRGDAGMRIQQGPAGTTTATNATTSKTVFTSGQPMMWDSSRDRHLNVPAGPSSAGGGEVEAGDCGYSSCVYTWDGVTHYGYVNRVYFRMNTSVLEKRNGYTATVYSATFSADEVGNSDGCVSQSVALYTAGSISSSTRWGGPQGSELSTASSAAGGGSGCGAGYVGDRS